MPERIDRDANVSAAEAADARDPSVGTGTPQTAPAETPSASLKPTRKLEAATVAALLLYALSLITEVDAQMEQAINVLVPLVLAYFVKNEPTPGGVPA